ncbi:hypothetical protein [Croceicoccus naphthovorans]|uniref:hypothetical protein n=1 Tax=Croceicoccus naphthovorans TaxID=1348774 RepID=UPI000B2193A9|nr:hypothetical protein [Croceicoccus naphthovorans]MBB3989520.1 hypothetical protein [Croceicoccus naphthovorans]
MRLRILRFLDRARDRRPVVRITRSSSHRRRSPWRSMLLLALTVLLIAVLLAWWQSSREVPSGWIAEISARPAPPTPEAEALPARLATSWMAMPGTGSRTHGKGGDHGH